MNLIVAPVTSTVTATALSWRIFGKAVEQQLRVTHVIQRACLAPLKSWPVGLTPTEEKPTPDFLNSRVETSSPKPKPVRAKPAETKAVVKPKTRATKTRSAPITKAKPRSAAPSQTEPAKITPTIAKPTAPNKADNKPSALKAKPAPASAAPKRTRQPSPPPALPEAPKK